MKTYSLIFIDDFPKDMPFRIIENIVAEINKNTTDYNVVIYDKNLTTSVRYKNVIDNILPELDNVVIFLDLQMYDIKVPVNLGYSKYTGLFVHDEIRINSKEIPICFFTNNYGERLPTDFYDKYITPYLCNHMIYKSDIEFSEKFKSYLTKTIIK